MMLNGHARTGTVARPRNATRLNPGTHRRRRGRAGSARRRRRDLQDAPVGGRGPAATRERSSGVTGSSRSPPTRVAVTVGRYTTREPCAHTAAHHSRTNARPPGSAGRSTLSQRLLAAATKPGAQQTGRTYSCQGALTSGERFAIKATERSWNTVPPADSSSPSARSVLPATAAVGSASASVAASSMAPGNGTT